MRNHPLIGGQHLIFLGFNHPRWCRLLPPSLRDDTSTFDGMFSPCYNLDLKQELDTQRHRYVYIIYIYTGKYIYLYIISIQVNIYNIYHFYIYIYIYVRSIIEINYLCLFLHPLLKEYICLCVKQILKNQIDEFYKPQQCRHEHCASSKTRILPSQKCGLRRLAPMLSTPGPLIPGIQNWFVADLHSSGWTSKSHPLLQQNGTQRICFARIHCFYALQTTISSTATRLAHLKKKTEFPWSSCTCGVFPALVVP